MTEGVSRVICLYRVSLAAQATGDDIPLQRTACAAFIQTKPGWQVVAEYTERGVSGYRTTQDRREALVKIKEAACRRAFDILLVYMFDRLGRREDEIPFMVEWLYAQGVTVWSVVEGPQKLAGHTDRLVNYMRYWQSGGESAHTSLRVAEKHRQMVADGQYRGGSPPYGYRLAASGRRNRRGRALRQPVIDEQESAVVRFMYAYIRQHACGCHTLARVLNARGCATRHGHKWTAPAVTRVLRNPIYKGDYLCGRVSRRQGVPRRNPADAWTHARAPLANLQLVTETEWEAVNALMDSRRKLSPPYASPRPPERLLGGLVYCGYCGVRLAVGGKGRRYDCPRRMRLDVCDGAYGYGAKGVDDAVWGVLAGWLIENNYLSAARTRVISVLTRRKSRLEKSMAESLLHGNAGQLAAQLQAVTAQLSRVRDESDFPTLLKRGLLAAFVKRVALRKESVKIYLRYA